MGHRTDFCTVRKTRLALNLIALIHTEDSDEDRVYTPMDIDDPALYNAMNLKSPESTPPMDVDGTGVNPSISTPEHLINVDTPPENNSDARSTKTYLGMSVGFESVPELTSDSQMKSPLLTSNQNTLPSIFLQHLEWESWGSDALEQKQGYKRKWAILRRHKELGFPLQFRHIPWPVFRTNATTDPEINTPSVEYFIFGETQAITSPHQARRLAKQNLKLFHSDKFTLVLDRVLSMDREWAKYCAEVVCRVLTRHLD
ncbi:hypothetical protein B0H14DRAFT_2730472 [Mycena olivaceomarginata]|nr:hypothetical protein B0H14DRAFT_2730472 [Mycena olivaceomarginata]